MESVAIIVLLLFEIVMLFAVVILLRRIEMKLHIKIEPKEENGFDSLMAEDAINAVEQRNKLAEFIYNALKNE